VGTLISLAALVLAGRLEGMQMFLALKLLPSMLLGLVVSRWVSRFWTDGGCGLLCLPSPPPGAFSP
jgi:hypothetical protein